MPIPCMSRNSTSLPSFICVRTLVSKIREFNQRKKKKKKKKKNIKMNNSGKSNLTPFPSSKWIYFLGKT